MLPAVIDFIHTIIENEIYLSMYYFYSPSYAVIKLDGVFTCTVSKNVALVDKVFSFVEIIPLDGKCPIAFDIAKPSICKNVSVLNSSKDTFIRVLYFPAESLPYKILAHAEKTINGNKFSTTAVSDGRLRLVTTVNSNMDVLELPFSPNEIEIDVFYLNGESFAGVFLKGNSINSLIIYELHNLDLKFEKIIDSFVCDSSLKIEQRLSDNKKHLVTSVWEAGNPFKCLSYKTTATVNKTFPDEMKGILFFEEMKVRGDLKEYLTPEMYNKQNLLYNFIGEISEIVPLPEKDNYLLIYKDKMKVFKLYYSNDVICNIVEAD